MKRLALALLLAGCGSDAGGADMAADLSAASDMATSSDLLTMLYCNATLTGGITANLAGCTMGPELEEQGTQWRLLVYLFPVGAPVTLTATIFGPGEAHTGTYQDTDLGNIFISADQHDDAGMSTNWVAMHGTGPTTLTLTQISGDADGGAVPAHGSLTSTLHLGGQPDTQLSVSF